MEDRAMAKASERGGEAKPRAHSDLSVLAASFVAEAIALCIPQFEGMDQPQIERNLKSGNLEICRSFRSFLAGQIAAYLGEIGGGVNQVFYMESLDEPCAEGPLNLIVLVDRKTEALNSLKDGLNASLVEEYRKIRGEESRNLKHWLNLVFLEPGEVENKVGDGAILAARFNPPVKIWDKTGD